MKVTKQQLIDEVHQQHMISKSVVELVIGSFLSSLREHMVNGDDVRIPEIGTFTTKVRPAHTGWNPVAKQPIEVAEKRLPHLKFNSNINAELNKQGE